MWNIQITKNNDETLNVTATCGSFSFPSTIRLDDDSLTTFVETAKAQYADYAKDKSVVDSLTEKITSLFN